MTIYDPIPHLSKLLTTGRSLPILNYPKKYPPNIGIQYKGLKDIHKILLGKGDDPTEIHHFLTPTDDFFIRNHFAYPKIENEKWQLSLSGNFRHPDTRLSLKEIKQFPQVNRVVCFECTGNQRAERFQYGQQVSAFLRESTLNKLNRFLDPVQLPITLQIIRRLIQGLGLTGGNFFDNALFRGVRLFDVLHQYPLLPEAKELVFAGLDHGYEMLTQRLTKKKINYARSFNIDKLRQYDPLLCFEMNGTPLTLAHGAPLRLIIPGFYGAEQIKWLGNITASQDKYKGHFQQEYYGYKINGEMIPVHEQRPKSMVIKVITKDGHLTVYGVAWRGLSPIDRIEVSIDQQQTWHPANLLCQEIDHSWLFWSFPLPQKLRGKQTIFPRVFCQDGQRQPLHPDRYSTVYGNNSVISATIRI